MIAQGTNAWHQERLGKFTASTFGDMLGKGRAKGEEFSVTAKSLMKTKIAENLTGEYVEITGKALEWGQEYEAEAVASYEDITGADVKPSPFVPLAGNEDWAGGSPDGSVEGENIIIEVKCPYNSANHIDALMEKDIPAKARKLYYTQVQFNMMVTGADFCDFVSYDPRMIDEKNKTFIKRIPRDEEYIEMIKERLGQGIAEMKEMLSKI